MSETSAEQAPEVELVEVSTSMTEDECTEYTVTFRGHDVRSAFSKDGERVRVWVDGKERFDG